MAVGEPPQRAPTTTTSYVRVMASSTSSESIRYGPTSAHLRRLGQCCVPAPPRLGGRPELRFGADLRLSDRRVRQVVRGSTRPVLAIWEDHSEDLSGVASVVMAVSGVCESLWTNADDRLPL